MRPTDPTPLDSHSTLHSPHAKRRWPLFCTTMKEHYGCVENNRERREFSPQRPKCSTSSKLRFTVQTHPQKIQPQSSPNSHSMPKLPCNNKQCTQASRHAPGGLSRLTQTSPDAYPLRKRGKESVGHHPTDRRPISRDHRPTETYPTLHVIVQMHWRGLVGWFRRGGPRAQAITPAHTLSSVPHFIPSGRPSNATDVTPPLGLASNSTTIHKSLLTTLHRHARTVGTMLPVCTSIFRAPPGLHSSNAVATVPSLSLLSQAQRLSN